MTQLKDRKSRLAEYFKKPEHPIFTNRMLFSLLLPLFAEQVLAVTIGVADTMMVSDAGETAISGVSNVDSINNLIINIFSALATGGAVITSQYIGSGNKSRANDSAKQLIWLMGIISFAFSAAAIIFNNQILNLFYKKAEYAVMHNSVVYFYVTGASYLFYALYAAGGALFRSMNNAKVCLYISLAMNIINVAGNYILINIAGIGVLGAGISTLLSRFIGCASMLYLILHKGQNKTERDITIEKIYKPKLTFETVGKILKIGIPTGVENCLFSLGVLLLQSLITSMGTTAMAANAVGKSVCGFSTTAGTAFSLAMITVVGRCMGAKDKAQAKYFSMKLMIITNIIMFVMSVGLAALSEPLTGLFNISAEAAKSATEILTTFGLFAAIFWSTAFTLPSVFRASGDITFTTVVSLLCMWTCRIMLAYVFALVFNLGVMSTWLAMCLDWVVRAIIYSIRYFSEAWLNKKVV